MKKIKERKVDILVISDVHLGTYGCRAKELSQYLSSIQPKMVVLNGDIIDIWQFSKRYWPKSHMKILKHICGWISEGVKVYYVTGNHDELLRKFAGFEMGSFSIVNKLLLELDNNKKAWIFHGDVFDITMQHSKWLAKLGAIGYDSLIALNSVVNYISEKILKKGKLSLSKKIKNSVKSAIRFIDDFEKTSAEIGIMNQYDFVICGHIHQPTIKTVSNQDGSITYLNSGDWIENLSSLEYCHGTWKIMYFNEDNCSKQTDDMDSEEVELNSAVLFDNLLKEFRLMKA